MISETILKTSNSPQDDSVLKGLFQEAGWTNATFDQLLTRSPAERLKVVYFWGDDCPNCANANEKLRAIKDDLAALPVEFHAVDAHQHAALANRFGLFGIPGFVFFKRGRLIGKIPSFPTQEEFLRALRRYA